MFDKSANNKKSVAKCFVADTARWVVLTYLFLGVCVLGRGHDRVSENSKLSVSDPWEGRQSDGG